MHIYIHLYIYNCRVRIVPSTDTLQKTLKRRKLVKDHAELMEARRKRINAQIAADILEKENEELRYIYMLIFVYMYIYIYMYICIYIYIYVYIYNAQIAADILKKENKELRYIFKHIYV
jgi:hypothetical protein